MPAQAMQIQQKQPIRTAMKLKKKSLLISICSQFLKGFTILEMNRGKCAWLAFMKGCLSKSPSPPEKRSRTIIALSILSGGRGSKTWVPN